MLEGLESEVRETMGGWGRVTSCEISIQLILE